MEAVGAGDDVALEHLGDAVGVGEPDAGGVAVDVLGNDVGDLEQQRRAAVELRGDEVLDHLGLAVDPDRAAAELGKVQLVPGARVLQVDAPVFQALPVQPVPETDVGQRVHGVLFEDAGANAGLDVGAAAVLQDDGVDALEGEQSRQQQTGRTGSDDSHLGAHAASVAPGSRGRNGCLPVSGIRPGRTLDR